MKSSRRNDAPEEASSPPQGMAAPQGLHPPLSSLPLLPPPATPVPAQRIAPARYHCKAAALCISIPHHTASAGFLRRRHPQGHSTNPNTPATGSPASRGTEVPCSSPTHPPPESKFEALAYFTLQACCMSKQICLQSVRLSVCQHLGVKEPTAQ